MGKPADLDAAPRCCEIAPLRGEDRRGAMVRIREQRGGDEGSVPLPDVRVAELFEVSRELTCLRRGGARQGKATAQRVVI